MKYEFHFKIWLKLLKHLLEFQFKEFAYQIPMFLKNQTEQ